MVRLGCGSFPGIGLKIEMKPLENQPYVTTSERILAFNFQLHFFLTILHDPLHVTPIQGIGSRHMAGVGVIHGNDLPDSGGNPTSQGFLESHGSATKQQCGRLGMGRSGG